MLNKSITLLLMLACLAGCMPRYHFDIEVLGAQISTEALPGEPARRNARAYIAVEYRAPDEFAYGNRAADLLACNTYRNFVSGHPSNREWAHGLVSQIDSSGTYRAVFDVSEFGKFLEPTGNPLAISGPWRLKPNYNANGVCFRARMPNVMYYGVSREFRIDQMLGPPLFVRADSTAVR